MGITLDWVFLCESVEFGPDGEVTSLHNILRPHVGFGWRPFPFRAQPVFFMSARGRPGEFLALHTTMSDGTLPPKVTLPVPFRLSATGADEIAIECADVLFVAPGTLTFGLWIDNREVFSTRAPLAQTLIYRT